MCAVDLIRTQRLLSLYPTYDVLQRYRQGNIIYRIHPAVRAICIYCTVVTTELYNWLFPILDSTCTEALGIQTG